MKNTHIYITEDTISSMKRPQYFPRKRFPMWVVKDHDGDTIYGPTIRENCERFFDKRRQS